MSEDRVTELWEKAALHLKDVLHPDVFERWIAVIRPVRAEGNTLVLGVDNDFYQQWLEEHYLPLIQNAVSAVCGEQLIIKFSVQKQQGAPPPAGEQVPPKKVSLRERLSSRRSKTVLPLNEKFTFDDFVVGPCNNFAHAASLAVAQAPARAYNPLFIYGGVGLGKTHLMQAIGHYVMQNSRCNVSYLSSESFINEYISALQNRSLVQFRKKYRHVDLLLIDDIHFLAGKDALQEEFFHTFNTLFDAHSQIVMTSDKPANEIVGLEQRLVSRFEWGLVTELEPPDLETRLAILNHKISKTSVQLTGDVLSFIAENVRSNIRSLEGALVRAISYVSLTSEELTVPLLKTLLKDAIDHEREEAINFPAIQKAVAEHYDIRVSDITGSRRPKAIAVPRQVAMYLCRVLTESSFPEIGNAFGKSHATVFHACKSIETKIQSDNSLRDVIHSIAKKLGKNL